MHQAFSCRRSISIRCFLPILSILLLLTTNAVGGPRRWNCVQCMAIQHAIRRVLHRQAASLQPEESLTEDELSSAIAGLCKSEEWRSAEYATHVRKGCSNKIREHLDFLVEWWGINRSKTGLQHMAHQRWLMHSVCTQPAAQACSMRSLSWSDEVDTSRCSLCRAITKDVYTMTRIAGRGIGQRQGGSFAAMKLRLGDVCDELALHRPLPAGDQEHVLVECKILVKDLQSKFEMLLLNRTAMFARNFCNEEVQLCPWELSTLPHADDGLNPGDKEEL